MTDPLPLTGRSGLPAEIAYLRDRYPQTGWQAHPRYGQLAAFWLHIHATLRSEATALTATTDLLRGRQIDPAAFQRRFVPELNGFLQHLDAHHRIEDTAYFPKFRALDPRMGVGFDLLERDHHAIHDALLTTVERARILLASLAGTGIEQAADGYADASGRLIAMLRQHLADEEELVIPAMLEHGERAVG